MELRDSVSGAPVPLSIGTRAKSLRERDIQVTPKGASTLVVIVVGMVVLGLFEGLLDYLRTYTLAHTTSCCEWIGSSPVIVPRHGLLAIGLEYERPWARGSLTALDVATGAKQ